MFHLAGYTASIDTTADSDVAAIVDSILSIQNSHFVLSQSMQLIAAAAMQATAGRAKLASPSMRQIASPWIRPIIAGATPGSNPNMWLLDQSPFTIPPYEEIQCQATGAQAMGSERFTACIWLQDVFRPCPVGNIIPVRFTSSTACVANVWTALTLSWGDTLPSGQYAMVLSEHHSAAGQAHRWIFPNQLYRPGFLSFTAGTQRHPYAISKGQFGLMGVFRSNDLPRFEALANGTDSTHVGYAHVVRVGSLS